MVQGAKVCKKIGWLEILSYGMIDPEVFKMVGYNPKYSGFAFGLGIEQIAMLKYGIDDVDFFMKTTNVFCPNFNISSLPGSVSFTTIT